MALLEGVRPEDPLDASSLTQEVSDALDEVHLARQAVDA
jgi:hypothetical protein